MVEDREVNVNGGRIDLAHLLERSHFGVGLAEPFLSGVMDGCRLVYKEERMFK